MQRKVTQNIISQLSAKHVFWLMMILPPHTILKECLPQDSPCLDQLQDLIQSSVAIEFHDLLLQHLDVIPDDFDQLIGKLESAFLRNNTLQNKRLLELTSHEGLKTAWIQTKSKEEVIDLIKDLDSRQIDHMLSMCDKTVRDEVETWLSAGNMPGFEENEVIARRFFGMESLRKNTANRISEGDQEKIIGHC